MRVTEPLESAQRNRRLATIRVDRVALMTNGTTFDGFDHTTVARLSIFANVLPMLSTANSVLSAGPTSISRTWSSPVFTSSRSRVSSSARRRRENRECVRVRVAYRRSPTARGDGVRIGGPFRAWADGWVSLVVQKNSIVKERCECFCTNWGRSYRGRTCKVSVLADGDLSRPEHADDFQPVQYGHVGFVLSQLRMGQ